MKEFMATYPWLFEGTITALLVFLLTYYYDYRRNKQRKKNLIVMYAIELKNNYHSCASFLRKVKKIHTGEFDKQYVFKPTFITDVWEETKFELASYLPEVVFNYSQFVHDYMYLIARMDNVGYKFIRAVPDLFDDVEYVLSLFELILKEITKDWKQPIGKITDKDLEKEELIDKARWEKAKNAIVLYNKRFE